jgi:hypothetical protein
MAGNKIQIQTNKILYQSSLGTPVYSDLNITGDSYTDDDGKVQTFTDINIPSAVFKTSRKKNILTTSINGNYSEIVEYMGAKNREIDVEILISGPSLLYPTADVANILTMLNSNQVLTVNSWFLNMLGVRNIVILDEDEPQIQGSLNNQHISFKCMAVKPLVLTFGVTGNSAGNTNNPNASLLA